LQTVADVDAALRARSGRRVGWPLDDVSQKSARPRSRPGGRDGAAALVRDDADIAKNRLPPQRDPALAFKLLRLVTPPPSPAWCRSPSFSTRDMLGLQEN